MHTQAWLSATAGVPVSLLVESIKFAHFYRAFQGAYISEQGDGLCKGRGGEEWSVNNESYINQASFFLPLFPLFFIKVIALHFIFLIVHEKRTKSTTNPPFHSSCFQSRMVEVNTKQRVVPTLVIFFPHRFKFRESAEYFSVNAQG